MGIELLFNECKVFILNIYMPTCCDENIDEFMRCLWKIKNIIDEIDTSNVFVLGDFNSNVKVTDGKANHIFGSELVKFCATVNYTLADVKLLRENNYTFYSEAHGSVSWLDHVMCIPDSFSLIKEIDILYSYISSDHHPVVVTLDVVKLDAKCIDKCKNTRKYIQWNDLTKEQI